MTKETKKPLLSKNNHKTIKGEKFGIITYILYMSPFTANSKGINVCSHASKGCAESCLVGSGMGGMYENVRNGRIRKTEYFLSDRTAFLTDLKNEIGKLVAKHSKQGDKVVFRLNGTSDIRYEKFKIFEGKNIFEVYPDVQFYDYSKNWLRFDTELPANYHLTFSRSETNNDKAMEILARGYNVAMVFDNLPETYKGYKVINGDESDLRFKDEKNVIVGLKYKKITGTGGKEKNLAAYASGFVIKTEQAKVVDKIEATYKESKKRYKNTLKKLVD